MSKAPLSNHVVFLLAVLVTGAVAGAFIWGFLFIMNISLSFLWNYIPNRLGVWFLPLIVCTAGGVVIGLCQKRYGALPEDMMTVMARVKSDGGYDTEQVKPAALCAILPLIFGGSIGPEAGLVGVIAGLCTGIGAKLRSLGDDFRELAAAGTTASLSAVFGAPLFAIAVPLEGGSGRGGTDEGSGRVGLDEDDSGSDGENAPAASDAARRFPRWVRIGAYIVAACGAFGIMMPLNGLFGHSSGLPHFDSISFGSGEMIAAVPALIAGAAAGWLFHGFEHVTGRAAGRIGDKPVLKAVTAGVVLGVCGTLLPFTMFAGESQIHELMELSTLLLPAEAATDVPASVALSGVTASSLLAGLAAAFDNAGMAISSHVGVVLVLTGFVKVFLTPLCVSFGWRGGHFFPVIFAGVVLGYGFAFILGADPVLAASVGAGAVVGGVMRKPVMATLLLFLCFPLSAAPLMLVSAFIASRLPLPRSWQQRETEGAEGAKASGADAVASAAN